MLWPKKNSYKEFDYQKNFLRLENPSPPPITFLTVRPLAIFFSVSFYCIVLRHFVVNTAIRQLHICYN